VYGFSSSVTVVWLTKIESNQMTFVDSLSDFVGLRSKSDLFGRYCWLWNYRTGLFLTSEWVNLGTVCPDGYLQQFGFLLLILLCAKPLYSAKVLVILPGHSRFPQIIPQPFVWQSWNTHTLFSVCSLKNDNVITSKPTWKLKHTNSILESSEYFCQISSKMILIILSYTVSKLVHCRRLQLLTWTATLAFHSRLQPCPFRPYFLFQLWN